MSSAGLFIESPTHTHKHTLQMSLSQVTLALCGWYVRDGRNRNAVLCVPTEVGRDNTVWPERKEGGERKAWVINKIKSNPSWLANWGQTIPG